jgi:outer membrane protein assembly factor BamD
MSVIHNNVPKRLFLPFIILLFCLACSSDKAVVRDLPFDAGLAFKQANEKIKKRDYEAAREILEDIKAQDTSQKYAALAQIRIGDTYFEEGLYEEAAIEYEMFLKLHPYHKYAPYAQYQLAMSYFKRIKGVDVSYSMAKQALIEFEKLQRRYPRNPYMDIAESRIKKCKSILAEYEFYVGKFYFKKGSYRAAAQRFNSLLQNYPDSKKESEALYYLGLSYEKMGEKDKAINVLTTLIEKFPATKLSGEAKELIASFNKKGE